MTSPHCVCHTVIHVCVLSSWTVPLEVQCVLAIVSGDSESSLHRVGIVCCISIRIHLTNPLHPLLWPRQLIVDDYEDAHSG